MAATLKVPLFPLPRMVLFPAVRLPFYIFEDRYRKMLADLLDGPGLVGIPQVLPGFEVSLGGSPPVARIFGVGRVMDYDTHDDGTSHIEVVGLHRARLLEESSEGPYRVGVAELLDDPDPSLVEGARLRKRIRRAVKELIPRHVEPAVQEPLNRLLEDEERTLPAVVNTLATVLVGDARVRQALLEIEGVGLRCRRLVTEIEELRKNLDGAEESGPDVEGEDTT